uniref:Short-chain dehydrogenase/reductase 3 n=2 Tax=Tetranychus urticae TaxID=32264 RepID=T1JZU1_TETUR
MIIIEIVHLLASIILIYVKSLIHLIFGKPRKDISGQVAVVTGAGHGLGRELALELSHKGAKVALLDINKPGVDKVDHEIKSTGGVSCSYQCDVTSQTDVQKVFNQIGDNLGPIDILINNAGITHCTPFMDLTPQQIRKTFEVNTLSHFWTISSVLPGMIARERGHIVAISSIAGLLGTPNVVEYCASKFAVNGLMTSLEKEIHANGANNNVHLTTICPLIMDTGMFKKPKTRFNSLLPICSPSDVAKTAIDSMLKNDSIITVPQSAMAIYRIEKIVPEEAAQKVQDWLDYGVGSHKSD